MKAAAEHMMDRTSSLSCKKTDSHPECLFAALQKTWQYTSFCRFLLLIFLFLFVQFLFLFVFVSHCSLLEISFFPVNCSYLNPWALPFMPPVGGGGKGAWEAFSVGVLKWRIPFPNHDKRMKIFKFLNQIFNPCCGTYQKFQSSCWLMFTSKGQTHTSCGCCGIIIARNVSTI